MIFATIFIVLCMIFIAFLGGMIVGAWIFSFENPEQEPRASCEYTEGSEWCIKHCPHDIEYGKMKTGHWIPIHEIVGNEQMEFPETWEEYEQEYGFNDSDEVYTNNSRLIQSFRVKQWLDHLEQEPKTGHWITVTNGRGGHECSLCHEYAPSYQNGDEWLTKYCPNCGARMVEQETKINEDISKGFEEFTRMMFKQGQAESEE